MNNILRFSALPLFFGALSLSGCAHHDSPTAIVTPAVAIAPVKHVATPSAKPVAVSTPLQFDYSYHGEDDLPVVRHVRYSHVRKVNRRRRVVAPVPQQVFEPTIEYAQPMAQNDSAPMNETPEREPQGRDSAPVETPQPTPAELTPRQRQELDYQVQDGAGSILRGN